MTKPLTVIIPTCNRRPWLERCLAALARQTALGQFDVVVTDDGSSDDTLTWLETHQAPFGLTVLTQENRGPATARNRAIAAAGGEILLIINDDTLLADDAVERHLATHTAAQGERRIVLGPFRVVPEKCRDLFTAMVDSTTHMFPFRRLATRELVAFPYFITCNTSLHRRAFDEAGLFDESFPKPAGEDIEMGYRLYKAGWRIGYDPDIISWHDTYYTPAGYARARFIRGEEDLRFLHKHPELIGIYQRHAMSFIRSHQDLLTRDYDGYGDYVASIVGAAERELGVYAAATAPSQRYRAHERIMTMVESLANLAYAHGAGKSPFFSDVIGKVAPQITY